MEVSLCLGSAAEVCFLFSVLSFLIVLLMMLVILSMCFQGFLLGAVNVVSVSNGWRRSAASLERGFTSEVGLPVQSTFNNSAIRPTQRVGLTLLCI